MDRTEANVEAKKIFDKWNEKTNEIEKKAKKDGIWKKEGLDSNNYLFKEINEKAGDYQLIVEKYKIFNWKEYFDIVDYLDEHDISYIVYA